MIPLRVAILVFLAASIQARPLDAPPSAAQLRKWMGDECVSAGKHVGFDYPGALERAIRKEPAGLAELFRFTVSGELDGEAAEEHSAILFGLLQRWGDRRFARVLRAQKLRIRKAVIDEIEFSFPDPVWKPTQFPLTYASAPHHNTR